MPTEIARPSAPPEVALAGVNTSEANSLGMTPLAIAAILALVLHVASGVMLDRSHASQTRAASDGCMTCPAEASPPAPSLPYD